VLGWEPTHTVAESVRTVIRERADLPAERPSPPITDDD
jgi:hypothetical protein